MSSAGPRVVPQDPQFATTSEREVWERLRAQGSEDWILLANVRLTDERKDHELDLVVLMPDVAIVVLEVKGGSVSIENDAWFTHTGDQHREIHPVDQARDGKYALRAYIERDPRWKNSSRADGLPANAASSRRRRSNSDFSAGSAASISRATCSAT